jgi:hypothetical protein
MIDNRKFNQNRLYYEMLLDEQSDWFSYNRYSFLNNVDTFYYSVKFKNDFRDNTKDAAVLKLRKYFNMEYRYLSNMESPGDIMIPGTGRYLTLKTVTFSRFYNICLSFPEYFDIFFAPIVPKGADGGESVTSECVVQIRSYMLWQMGVRDCFENSYFYVKAIADYFGLTVDHVQENRADYCWHTNYLDNPEKFFNPDNFYKMRVDRFKNATYVTNKVGAEDYEIDYVALGKRSDKVFVRIYQKTREVIEQGYKPWFFKIWEMHGMISRYDKYVYEKAYEKRSWFYRFYARLEFYREHGADPKMLEYVDRILNGDVKIDENSLIKLADELTPKLHYVVNVEYQTMRRHSKSYELLPIHNNSDKGECQRVYDYIDNRKLIQDYLTLNVFRMVKKEGDANKSRRELCPFWEALRKTRCLDMKMTNDEVRLVRNYNRQLNVNAMKKRVLNSAVTLGFYQRGINEDSPLQDAFEALLKFNDNDINAAMSYKSKKRLQLNADELANVFESNEHHRFELLDKETGVLYDNNILNSLDLQAKIENLDTNVCVRGDKDVNNPGV